MMNPGAIMGFMKAKKTFENTHPRFAAMFRQIISGKMIEEGSIIEVTVTKPDGSKVTGNMRVQASDIELFSQLSSLGK